MRASFCPKGGLANGRERESRRRVFSRFIRESSARENVQFRARRRLRLAKLRRRCACRRRRLFSAPAAKFKHGRRSAEQTSREEYTSELLDLIVTQTANLISILISARGSRPRRRCAGAQLRRQRRRPNWQRVRWRRICLPASAATIAAPISAPERLANVQIAERKSRAAPH